MRFDNTYRLAAVALIALLSFGCGPSARDKALQASLISVNAARDGFLTWDDLHQKEIVKEAGTVADGEATLASYRQKRSLIVASFEVAYRALATAAITPSDANWALYLTQAAALYQAIKTLTGQAPAAPQAPQAP